jgi:hypothetical protein
MSEGVKDRFLAIFEMLHDLESRVERERSPQKFPQPRLIRERL